MLARFQQAAPSAGAMVPLRKPGVVTKSSSAGRKP
jgi:hypothetical protein